MRGVARRCRLAIGRRFLAAAWPQRVDCGEWRFFSLLGFILPGGVRYVFAGNYENQIRPQKTLRDTTVENEATSIVQPSIPLLQDTHQASFFVILSTRDV